MTVVLGCGPSLSPDAAEDSTGAVGSSSTGAGSDTSAWPPGGPTTTTPPPPPSSSSSSDGADDETDTTDDGYTFITRPDGGGCHDTATPYHCTYCEPSAQDCPEEEKCLPWSADGDDEWDRTRCSPLDPEPAAIGEPCTVEDSAVSGLDNCERHAMCWGVDPDTLMGTCRSFCEGHEKGCPGDQQCAVFNGWVLPICVVPCDPLAESPCDDPSDICRLTPEGSYCLPAQGGIIQDSGMVCGDTSCEAGSACMGDSFVPVCEGECCAEFCDLADPSANEQCAEVDPAMQCVAATDPPTDLGVCAIP